MIGELALLLLAPQAQPPDAAALVSNYRNMTAVAPPVVPSCARDDGADITVCGRRDSDQRLPLREERETASAGRSSGRDEALCVADTGGPCPVCPPTGCTGVNLLAVPFKAYRIVKALIAPDD
ncbi:MAG TPA: hypothetical protein VFT56_12115 [Sphingomonas sp.]|nr:hypothetical protein [Sphingomonas sp.]